MRRRLDLSTYVVTDTGLCGGPDGVVDTVRRAVAGGATIMQLRDPDATDDALVRLGRRLVAELDGSGVPLVINDHVHLVRPIGAAGVHVGQDDTPVEQARAELGSDAIVGLSVTSPAQADAAERLLQTSGHAHDLDYLGVGPLRATSSKPDHDPEIGLGGVAAAIARTSLPAVVIGGVTAADAPDLRAAGARGLSVVSAVCGQPDPTAATRTLADAWQHARRVPNVLSIAGSDPSGGAGVQADLKAFSALGAYGACVLTALTAQSTQGVTGVHPVPVDFIAAQLDTLLADVRLDAVKIGMIGARALAERLAGYLEQEPLRDLPVVLDPVMVATSGDRLIDVDAEDAVRDLLPLVDVVTPNVHEAALLAGLDPARTLDDLRRQADVLHERGARGVLLKGGHLDDTDEACDVWSADSAQLVLTAPRYDTPHTHGTGCSLSSALAALRPQRASWPAAAREAKAWLTDAIAAGAPGGPLHVGHGHGPVHHFHDTWRHL